MSFSWNFRVRFKIQRGKESVIKQGGLTAGKRDYGGMIVYETLA